MLYTVITSFLPRLIIFHVLVLQFMYEDALEEFTDIEDAIYNYESKDPNVVGGDIMIDPENPNFQVIQS